MFVFSDTIYYLYFNFKFILKMGAAGNKKPKRLDSKSKGKSEYQMEKAVAESTGKHKKNK